MLHLVPEPEGSVVYLGCPRAERGQTENALWAVGLSVIWADDVPHALSELRRRDVPLLLDLSRGPVALRYAREIMSERASTLMFAVVDAQRPEMTTEAVLGGMADVFARPLAGRRVANAIKREFGYSGSRADAPVELTGEDLYCHSSSMREVVTLIARAATMRTGALIRGEDSTGRQMVARSIHSWRATKDAPFIAVDCAAFDAEQLEDVLFGASARPDSGRSGHGLERVSRPSLLCDANGGTLYLKNLGEAPTRVQGRLARALRDREAELVETGETLTLDVRPVAGVDPGVDDMVREGRVREDLFRRLSVIRIDLPPLRNRREDIPALANCFLRQICARLGVPVKTWTRPALSLISALPWRGNAAELRSLLEQVASSVGGSRAIALEDLLTHVRLDGGTVVGGAGGTLRQARTRFEREYIAAVLDQHQGRISEAAKALGIQRTNLYRKMRSLRVARKR